MAHYKRKRPRMAGKWGYSRKGLDYRLGNDPERVLWLANWPRWHDILYHSRPPRRRTKALERRVLKGDDPDNLVWPDGRKPHEYYW